MRPTHYLRKVLATDEVQRLPFMDAHFAEAGVLPSPMAGMPQLEAYQLVNKWNTNQSRQRTMYALER